MIDEDKYCIDILTPVSAMTKALQPVTLGLLDDHLNHCVRGAAAEGRPEADRRPTGRSRKPPTPSPDWSVARPFVIIPPSEPRISPCP